MNYGDWYQTLRDWVHRYNAEGLSGLCDRDHPGRPPRLTMAQKAGYEAAFLNFGGGLGTDLPPYALPRVHVTAGMSRAEFDAHVSGFYARLQRRAGRGSKNVGMTHGSASK